MPEKLFPSPDFVPFRSMYTLLFAKMNQLTKYLPTGTILGLACVLLFACSSPKPAETAPETGEVGSLLPDEITLSPAQMAEIKLQTDTLHQLSLGRTISATGILGLPPQYQAAVSAPMGGIVREIKGIIGTPVRKGETLTVLENPAYIEIQQQYAEAVSELPFLQEEYERQAALAADSINATKQRSAAKAAYEGAKARVAGLAETLKVLGFDPEEAAAGTFRSRMRIVAPISGFLANVPIRLGQQVSPDMILFEMIDPSHLHLELQVFERDIVGVQKGQEIRYRVPSLGSEVAVGEVFLVGRSLDNTDRYVHVHGHIDADRRKLWPGMFVEAEIVGAAQPQPALPVSALVREPGADYVFVQEATEPSGSHFIKIPVEVGETSGDWVTVRLPETYPRGTRFVSQGGFFLASALEVME
ncbi:MAG: efflux RND transporter periplasmic adaptor subunit [Bacteroidetes bacterium]|nr:MAG: efflux RND transporter periplasmic adaptor subunit [Bacteroidota bacterium]